MKREKKKLLRFALVSPDTHAEWNFAFSFSASFLMRFRGRNGERAEHEIVICQRISSIIKWIPRSDGDWTQHEFAQKSYFSERNRLRSRGELTRVFYGFG
jgi:hypothetical protein